MARRRIMVPGGGIVGTEVRLDAALAHYARDVLRLRDGDEVELCDGEGCLANGQVRAADKRGVSIAVEGAPVQAALPPPPAVTLIQAVGKGDKLDAVVRQATELGVSVIRPVVTARAVARGEGRAVRWRAIAEDAVRVSGRAFRPKLFDVQPLEAVLAGARSPVALFLDVGARSSLAERLGQTEVPETVEVLVGPEGGFTDDERARVLEAGFSPVQLGAHTLRTETAGPAMLAILGYWAQVVRGPGHRA